jgi:hypothetical protein
MTFSKMQKKEKLVYDIILNNIRDLNKTLIFLYVIVRHSFFFAKIIKWETFFAIKFFWNLSPFSYSEVVFEKKVFQEKIHKFYDIVLKNKWTKRQIFPHFADLA